ncbi:hypothetical protein LIT25_14150 [Bacillus sp. F19]|nr:hypothetical protein LIT25_14150 [Bacillus sp. F19]
MIHNKVVNSTPNEAKQVSAPYFCEYREIVGAEGITETITEITNIGIGTDEAAKGSNSKGISRSLATAIFHK